jgi:NAD-dependent deacetylase
MSSNVYDQIADMMIKSRMTVVLTGAGVSTESGIPDFRSPGSGLWEKIDPMEALSAEVLLKEPAKFYSMGFEILKFMKCKKPNMAHLILADMEKTGIIDSIITQNIDNLHYEAGSRNIMEIHGNIRTGRCMRCRKEYDFKIMEEKVKGGEVPPICKCGGVIRPDVVLFGDSLPDCFDKAWKIAGKCELMIVIGSSLQVTPANYLPSLAENLVIINSGSTTMDDRAGVLCRERASEALKKIYARIREIKENGYD